MEEKYIHIYLSLPLKVYSMVGTGAGRGKGRNISLWPLDSSAYPCSTSQENLTMTEALFCLPASVIFAVLASGTGWLQPITKVEI